MKKIQIYIILAFLSMSAFIINACVSYQSSKPSTQSYIKIEGKTTIKPNVVQSFAPKDQLKMVREKLEVKKDFRVRIFGDSHMAGDFFSRELRKLFLQANAVGFAYALQPKYQQILILDYESKDFEILNSHLDNEAYEYPMGGIVASAKKGNAYVHLNVNLKQNIFDVGIIFKGKFQVQDERGKKFALNSSTFSFKDYKKLHFPLTITALEQGAVLGGYFIRNEKDNLIIDTLGINGARSNLWQKWDEKLLKQNLNTLKSDIVILAYGSNDSLMGNFNKQKFKSEYANFIRIIKEVNPGTLIVFISPPTVTHKVGGNYELNRDFYAVREAIYELAEEQKAVLFDMHELMEQSGGKNEWIQKKLSNQDVHLSIEGYKLMAREFYAHFMQNLK